MMTWDEYERTRVLRRPYDWQERPEGPDQIDLFVNDLRLSGGIVTRADVLAAIQIKS